MQKRTQVGFSLVELMVALLIGVVLTSGVISVFITSKSSYSINNAVGQVQEAGRFAMTTMQPLVSLAGFLGCANNYGTHRGSVTNQLADESDWANKFEYPVYGFEFTNTGANNTVTGSTTPAVDNTTSDWSPDLSNSAEVVNAVNNIAVKNSDMFLVHEATGNPAQLVSPYNDATTIDYYYASTNAEPLSAGDVAVASTCQSAEIFQITSSTGSPGGTGTVQAATSGVSIGNKSNPWNSSEFQIAGSQIAQMHTYLFFVGKGIDGGYSLWEASLTADSGTKANNGLLTTVREIVPGVENMQVLYGVDSTGDQIPDSFETASQVDAAGAWLKVVCLRIALMVRSDDNAIPKEQMPTAATGTQMLGVGFSDAVTYYPPVDRRLHRYFVQTISLRNTLP